MQDCNHTPKITRSPAVANPCAITRSQWDAFWARRERTSPARDWTNYTDGGHWMGSGKDPSHLGKQELSTSSKAALHLSWPTNGCVQKFREQTSEINFKVSVMAGILAGLATRNAGLGTSIGTGVGTSWLLDQAGGLRVHRGWSYALEVEWSFTIASRPSWREPDIDLSLNRKETLRDETGKAQYFKTHTHKEDRASEWPPDMLWTFVSGVTGTTDGATRIVCPDASVLVHSD
ncbi:hypothetical protein So717_26710 [Roseobacter cerasinus]|uniref:Uncharacterized protein n=1 Tax=Roseobacter cerasinus TaxID=2602289 RepID=A0A640VRA0_9RHOB|nr:hypothetical protein [Roseobacter cerasinus]GFE50918.1 hypothetical protein So717_26710 [Roseobacter cerasinus]